MFKHVRLQNRLAIAKFNLKLDDRSKPDLQRSSLNRTNGHYCVHQQRFRLHTFGRPHGSTRQKICALQNPSSGTNCAPDVVRLSKFTHDLLWSFFAWLPILNQIELYLRVYDWEFALKRQALVLRLPIRDRRLIPNFLGLPMVVWFDDLADITNSKYISHMPPYLVSEDLLSREPWVPLLKRIVCRAWRVSFNDCKA